MTESDDSNLYQFPRWSTTTIRPHSSLPAKSASDMFQLGIDNRNQFDKLSKKGLIRHNIHIPTGTRVFSPPLLNQPASTPDLCSIVDQSRSIASNTPIPVRIKSAALTIPTKINSKKVFSNNFPKQSHERRKITQERKRQKQQAYRYTHEDSEIWFQLRKSLAELKRLATTEDILVDPSTSLFNCDGYSFEALKQVINEQQGQKKNNRFRSESGISSSMDTLRSSNNRSRTSLTPSQNSASRSRITRPSTETFFRPIFEPLIVAPKPLHPLLLTGNNHPSKIKSKPKKPPPSAPPRVRFPHLSAFEKRTQSTLSDLSTIDDIPVSLTPSPNLKILNEEEEEEEMKTPDLSVSDNRRSSSNLSLKSTIKLKGQMPRSRSANDILNKSYPRFILITDQEHRIESWYHQYPFIVSDDLLQSFQAKTNKSTVSAYFIDNHPQTSYSNLTKKTFLQGKPFHVNNDWKKYDLIFISNNIYQQIIIYLQTIIKLSGKLIHVYQINHNEDLKTQVKYISKLLNQQILSHT